MTPPPGPRWSEPTRPRRSSATAPSRGETPPSSRPEGCDNVARLILGGLVVALPWMFGGTLSGALYGSCVAVTAVLVLWLVSLFTGIQRGFAIPMTAVPLLLAVALGLFQTVPMELQDLQALSPTAAHIWQAVEPLRTSVNSLGTVSLNPAGTRLDTSLLVLAGITFLLGARFFADERAQRRLWTALAINGAALAVFGIVQQATWNGRLYWTVEPTQVLNAFGPYVNHNNAAGYLNMCLGGALVLVAASRRTGARSAPQAGEGAASSERLLGIVAGVAILAGVMFSLSRGAYVSLGVALLVTLVFSWRRIRLGMLPGWTPVAGGVIVVLLLGLSASATVQQRLASIVHQRLAPDGRLAHWADSIHAVPDYRWFGSGLGTYRYVYRGYATDPVEEWFYHAENQYLEAAVEGGLVGLSLMLLAIGGVLWAIRHQLQQDPVAEDGWLALAALFALVTQAVHAFFDFGLYLPANMLLLALICGAACGRASRFGIFSPSYRGVAVSGPESLSVAFVVVLALLAESAFPLHETRTAQAVETARRQLQPQMDAAGADVLLLETALAQFADTAASREGDAEAQRTLARAWEYLYRRRALEDLTAGMTDEERVQRHGELWPTTHPEWLRTRYAELVADGRFGTADRLRLHPVVTDTLPQARAAYLRAVRACPVLAAGALEAAELAFVDPQASVEPCLELLGMVGRGEPRLMYRGGILAEESGQTDRAFAFWRECLARSDEYVAEIVERASKHADLPELIAQVLPETPLAYIRLARGRFSGAKYASERAMLLEHAEALLAAQGSDTAESLRVRGTLFAMQDDLDRSISAYGAALRIEPMQTSWRYELAEVLRDARRIDEAREQIRICVSLEPDNKQYRDLLQELMRDG